MEGWQTRRIGEAFRIVNGGTPKTGVAAYWGGSHQWITPAEMGGLASPYLSTARRALTDEGLRVGADLVPANSIILSSRAPIGHLVINDVPMAFNQGCKGLVPSAGIDTKFAYYFLLASVPLLNSLGTGATFRELSSGKLKEVAFRYPALPEQRRLVAILDEAFDGIANAKASVERNLHNARELFAGLSDRLFPQDEREPSEHSLDDLCEAIVDCEHKTAPTQDEGIPSIRTPNIGPGELLLDGVNRVSEATYKEWTRRAEPKPGDLILAREAPAGNVAVIPEGMRVCLGQRTVLLRPRRDTFEPIYLAHLLLQRNSRRRLLAHSRGATVQHINVKDIREFKLASVPTLSEQRAAVAEIKQLAERENVLLTIYRRKLAVLDELKQSLLHQAFTGQLTKTKSVSLSVQPVQTATPEFAADVIAFAYAQHERKRRANTFGRVKEQKTLHLIEAIPKIDLGRRPIRDAAGPNDMQHMLRAEEWAKANDFFEMVDRGGGYEFRKLGAFDQQLSRASRVLAPYLTQLERVVDLLVPMDTEEAEVFATVHAAWNNLLIDGAEVNDDAIVSVAREHWHADKLRIPEHKFLKAIGLVRHKGLVPDGTAKYVGGQLGLVLDGSARREH